MAMRFSALGGLVFAATLVVGFGLDVGIFLTSGAPPQLFASSIQADLGRAATSVVWRAELWTYILAIIPFCVFLPGLREWLSQRDSALVEVGAVMAGLFISLHTVHNMAYAAVVTGIAPTYSAGTAAGVASEQVARGLIAFAETAFLPGGGLGAIPLVIALTTFGFGQRRAGAGKTGVLAFTAAALTAVGYLRTVIPDMVVLPVALAGWVVFIAWVAATSLTLREVSERGSASRAGSRSAAMAG